MTKRKPAPKLVIQPEGKPSCDNHPDREASLITDGKKFQVLHLCEVCIPAHWR